MENIIIWVIVYIAWRVIKSFFANIKDNINLQEEGQTKLNDFPKTYKPFNDGTYYNDDNKVYEDVDVEGEYYTEQIHNNTFHQSDNSSMHDYSQHHALSENDKQINVNNIDSQTDIFNWSNQTLINSIIVSEVLGLPKARKN